MWLGHYHPIFNYTILLACVRADANADDRSNTIPPCLKKESEYDQEIPHSQTADKPVASLGRAT